MVQLNDAIKAWNTDRFESTLKQELEALTAKELPLQQGLSAGNYALDNDIKVMILRVSDDANLVQVKVGIFYSGIIGGCSCADDPTPIDALNEYCEIQVDINKSTAEMKAVLIRD